MGYGLGSGFETGIEFSFGARVGVEAGFRIGVWFMKKSQRWVSTLGVRVELPNG